MKHSSIQAFLTMICLTLFSFSSLNSQNECNTPHPLTDPLKDLPQANTTGDPVYVKVYATIPRLTDGSLGASLGTFMEEFEFAQEAFKEHNIYLGLGCLTELNNTGAYNDLRHPAYERYEDGLNLIIYDQNSNGNAGFAGSIPSKWAWANVNSPSTLAHEIGHCLGLLHTYYANQCNCQPSGLLDCEKVTRDPNNPNYNCEDAGDYVCDTEANSGQNFVMSDCQTLVLSPCSDMHGDLFQPDIDNIMSKFRKDCRTVFTPGQGDRMRSFLISDPDMIEVTRNDLIINGETKTINGYVDMDILFLDAGTHVTNTLENSNIQFAPDKGIKVLGGNYNQINNCILTAANVNACNETPSVQLWNGIEVATSIYILDSEINYAKRGVYNAPTVLNRTNLWIEFTEFSDNEIAIYQETNNSQATPSWAVVNGCSFDFTESRTGFPLQYHIRTVGSIMWVTRSTFDQSVVQDPENGSFYSAIYNYESQLNVRGTSTVQNKFRDFSTAIHDLAGFTNYGISVFYNNEFLDNYEAISANGSSPSISDNQVLMRNKKRGSVSAFDLNRCGQFELSGNRVENPYTSSVENQRMASIYQTGARNNLIDNNTAEACRNILQVTGVAGSQNGVGLMFSCNESIDGDNYDFSLFGNVHPMQGTPDFPANNKFSNTAIDPIPPNGPLPYRDIYNAGSYTVNYYWDTNFPDHNPDERFNVAGKEVLTTQSQCTPGSSLSSGSNDEEVDHEVRYHELTALIDTLYSNTLTDTSEAVLHSLWAKEFERDILIRDALIQLSNPSDSIDENMAINYDSVRIWLNRYNDMWSKIQVAKTYLQEGDTLGYDQYITSIPSFGTFSSEEMTAYNDFKDAVQIIRLAEGEGRSRATLNELEQGDIYQIATANETYVGQYAKNLLRTFYGYTFQEQPIANPLLADERVAVKEETQPFFYPNPTQDELKFMLPNKESTYWVQIRDLRGHLMHEQRAVDEQVIQVGQFPSGLYLVSIEDDKGGFNVQKLYIQ